MNRILFNHQADSYEMDLQDPRFEHVRGVLRMRNGDCFDAGVVNGPVGKATIVELDSDKMRVEVRWADVPPLPPPVHLIVGMCRPATARKILLNVPTLGIRRLTFVETGRSDPAYARSSLWKTDEWRQLLIKGTEQAFDTHIPELSRLADWTELNERLPGDDTPRLALDVYEGAQAFSACELSADKGAVLAIGPERGWNKQDRQQLIGYGFDLVSLNDRVLKVETAVIVGLTIILTKLAVY